MPAWTQEELDQLRQLREQERAEFDREQKRWNEAVAGFEEDETTYIIQYRLDGRSQWFGASPFFEPLRVRPEETHDEDEAHRVAAEILAGKRGVTKQTPPNGDIVAVQIVEHYSRTTIISQTYI